MLILSRKTSEQIVIDGGRIRIMVVEIREDKVRLGITAPRDVPIDREEIHELKRAELNDLAEITKVAF